MNSQTPITSIAQAASLGGIARNKAMTPEQRSESARRAVEARWAKVAGKRSPVAIAKAIKEAPLKIENGSGGFIEFECAVLDDNDDINKATRVISERAFARAIGAKRGGSHWQRRKKNAGANLPVFLSASNLSPFITMDLASALSEPISYIMERGGLAHGIKAELIPKMLDVWLKARDAGKLTKKQTNFANIADILMRGLAATGIVALIDEATGIQEIRASDYLAKFLARYVQAELRAYLSAFPVSFFKHLCRLRNRPFREDMKLPRYFGHIVNDLVYARLAPGALADLKKKNPTKEDGRRKHKNFQYLTENLGDPKLAYHLGRLEGIAEDFADGEYEAFHAKVDQKFRKYAPVPLLKDFIDSDGNYLETVGTKSGGKKNA
jgi:hypothetical protein